MSETSYTLTVEEDKTTGDLYLTFPPDVLEELDWTEETELEWKELDNNRWSIQKVKHQK